MDHPYPWLRYLDAGDLDDSDIDFDGMRVESPTGEHLGDTDGFIVDSESGRPYYAVVDAGGWFKSKHFLLPVGHVRLDKGNEVLKADLTQDRVSQFPGFDVNQFDSLTPDDVKRLNDETLRVYTVSSAAYSYSATEPYSAAWNRPDFRSPDWWRPSSSSARTSSAPGATSSTSRDRVPPETSGRPARDRDAVSAHEPSPHFDGRAQPGDVIGIETGGENTEIGDTREDENKRRERAEKGAQRRD